MSDQGEGDATVRTVVPSYAEVFRTRGYLPIFAATMLSTWGDYLARVTVAAFVLERTGSPLATAATFAVSLLPTIFGRSLLAPISDRIPYKFVLLATHLVRALLVCLLIAAVSMSAGLWALLGLMFLVELAGGPVAPATQILMTDMFRNRRVYARAIGLNTLSEQLNQAVGLAVGGIAVAVIGASRALWFDLLTFLVSAAVVSVVLTAKPVIGTPSAGLGGFFKDIVEGAAYLVRDRVLASLLGLGICAVLAMTAPEAVALAYAQAANGSPRYGGLLMAAPILGAVVGILIVSRWAPERQNSRIIWMALLMPLPLLVTVLEPPLSVTWVVWFCSGVLQAFMLPLQATFNLVVPEHFRGRVFGLAGAVSVTASGVAFLLCGLIAQVTTPAAAVGVGAIVSLGAVVLVAARWPRARLREAVNTAYGGR